MPSSEEAEEGEEELGDDEEVRQRQTSTLSGYQMSEPLAEWKAEMVRLWGDELPDTLSYCRT